MKFAAVAFFATALISLPLPLATARRLLAESPPAAQTLQSSADDRANLTVILDLSSTPFQTFLRYLQQTNLVEVFERQAYRTHHGITVFAPGDRAFAAVDPSALSGLKRHQLRNLMMYHALARHYALKEFGALSQLSPVTTFAGGLYTVNLTYDAGDVHVRSSWAVAQVVGTVYATAPMAVYEVDRVLLPDAIFRARPHVAAIPAANAAPAPAPDDDAKSSSPGRKESSACRPGVRPAAIYVAAAAAALGAVTLVAL